MQKKPSLCLSCIVLYKTFAQIPNITLSLFNNISNFWNPWQLRYNTVYLFNAYPISTLVNKWITIRIIHQLEGFSTILMVYVYNWYLIADPWNWWIIQDSPQALISKNVNCSRCNMNANTLLPEPSAYVWFYGRNSGFTLKTCKPNRHIFSS